jgi:demethylmenaquinone methyltransferase/2-methoxy-6-polyprenyl-1,4-benzoquinol methylase
MGTHRRGAAHPDAGVPGRTIPRVLFAGRQAAPGPERIGEYLEDRDLHRMFEAIGGTYDAQNHLLSLGRDIRWRRVLAERLRAAAGGTVCDMATGTGDVAIAAARRWPSVRVVGIDYSERMLSVARRKLGSLPPSVSRRVSLRWGDIRRSGLPDGFADMLTNTFALRNLPDRMQVLREFHRVLKPGGRLFIMEPGIPSAGAPRLLYRAYLAAVLPLLGNLLSRTDYAYTYLKRSIEGFPEPEEFIRELGRAGFSHCRAALLDYGIAVLYSAVKGEDGA